MGILFTVLFTLLSLGDLTSAKELTDVSYDFAATKLSTVSSASDLLTSFVDYFYLLIAKNNSNLVTVSPAAPYAGWCVGDAHLENFGALILEDGISLFTMNDMDDSGPCPVALDLYRLMVSARLNNGGMNLSEMLAAYADGLAGISRKAPSVVEKLLIKSAERGAKVDMKNVDAAVMRFVRSADSLELSARERDLVSTSISAMAALGKARVLDMIRRVKISGGSGGRLRYEILLQLDGELLHIELKEQVRPGIYPVASSDIPNVMQRIAQSLKFTQGASASRFFQTTNIDGADMLVRPRFAGNVAVKTSSLGDRDFFELAVYQAYTLGRIHARSVDMNWLQVFKKITPEMWTQDVNAMVAQFKKKFGKLQANSH